MRPLLAIGFSLTTLTITPPALVQAQSVEDLYRQAAAAYRTGDYSQAETILQQILQLTPDDAIAHAGLGGVLSVQGRDEEAEEAFRQALLLDPNNAFAYTGLGEFLREQGRDEEAEDILREAIRLDPNDALAYNNLGTALERQGREAEAEAAFEEARRLGFELPF
ncbi:MAG: tetratricopeptide repeat protein [Leptolyngbya sp. SIO1E4]|nr:tetratricopeptide repeat protein [Leptolyngbya sp. SIO1E4]